MNTLKVTSEIGPLKTVMIHNPGKEIDTMVPDQMQELLFDDILFGKEAREEHQLFRDILSLRAKVVDVQDLLIEAISSEAIKEQAFQNLTHLIALSSECQEVLKSYAPKEFAMAMIEGIRNEAKKREKDGLFLLDPIPNLLFMRDPGFIFQDQLFISSMFAKARVREPFILKCIFSYHPQWKTDRQHFLDSHSQQSSPYFKRNRPTIEGGDVLILSKDLVCCGASQRTNRLGVESLVDALREGTECKTLLICEIMPNRAYMHLDTIFTQINHDEFLVYPRLIGKEASQQVQVYRVDLMKKGISYEKRGGLIEALESEGFRVVNIDCGGKDEISQQREQWTDASNAFAMAPGVIFTYAHNVKTAEELSRAGYEIVTPEDFRKRVGSWVVDGSKKIVFQIWGNELGRARGGPRCMSMPLEREW